jgi:SAM-dependent methyltransferase
VHDFTQQNRRAWNEIAAPRHQVSFPTAEFFGQGGSLLDPRVVEAAGDVRGKTLLHLQCSTGSDTLSWAAHGAQATGVDISDEQIAIAQRAARDAGLSARFIAADVYDLPDELRGSFDIVFTGGGSLVWLPDIDRWAQVVASALRPDGLFLLFEEHPVAGCMEVQDGNVRVTSDYFGRNAPIIDQGWTHFKGGESAQELKYEFAWPLGDVITALAQAGLSIVALHEYPSSAEWRLGDALESMAGLPGEYLLLARKLS